MKRGREGAAQRKMECKVIETRERFPTDASGKITQEERIRIEAHKQEENCIK